jgi:hypothetical protein
MRGPLREQGSSASSVRTDVQSGKYTKTVTIAPSGDFDACAVTFHFEGKVDGLPYPSLSPGQQDTFVAVFCQELDRLRAWCASQRWRPDACPALQVFVSDEYRISRALIPAALGQRGRIEFPAWRFVFGEAAIAHELAHVYFPNGNRLLAEGLAIYLQATIGGNPSFPNFGRPLHEIAIDVLGRMVPEFANGDSKALDAVHLGLLDRIATPSGLRLRVGSQLYQIDDVGFAHTYPLAGSFVAFLIEAHGPERFRDLCLRTPLKPFERNAGAPERWSEIYGIPLDAIEREWKVMLVARTGMR